MFGRCGSDAGIDLHDRAEHHELPVGPRRGDAVEQVDVEPLVDARRRSRAAGAGSPPDRRARRAIRRACAKCATSTLLGNAWTFGC